MEVYLKKDVNFVTGYRNAAIYDNINNKVYEINENGRNIIEKIILRQEIKSKIEKDYINKLMELDLLSTEYCKYNREIKKPRKKLIYAWLEITEMCNLNCIHCYGQFGRPKIDKDKILTVTEWKKIIDGLIKSGCKDIQLIGGEPTIYKEFYEILKYAHKQGMKRIDVFTNGTLIDEKSIKIFKENNVKVRVSIYGHNSEIHDKITNQKGSFDLTQKALLLLKENNIPTTIAVVIMKENERYINKIKNYIIKLGYKYNGYDVIRPTCINNDKNHSVTDFNILKPRYNTRPEFYTSKNSFINNHFYNSCWNGKIVINSTGDILPCIFSRDEKIGNIKVNTKKEIEQKMMEYWSITKDSIEVCKDCEFRYCCHDCRPLAKAINGDLKSKYPRCCYNPYKGEWEKIEKVTKEII